MIPGRKKADIDPTGLLAKIENLDVPPSSPCFSATLMARLAPLVEQNRRKAGFGPLPSTLRTAWGLGRRRARTGAWAVGVLITAALGRLLAPVGGLAYWAVAALLTVTALLVAYLSHRPVSRTWAEVVAGWMGRIVLWFPGIPPGSVKLLDPSEHGGGVLRVMQLALGLRLAAGIELRRHDATLRFGRSLGCAGVGVIVVGFMGLSSGFPGAATQVGAGLATCVVGYYLGETKNLLMEDVDEMGSSPRRAGRHRVLLGAALAALAVLGVWTSARFHPIGVAGGKAAAAWTGMAAGAVLAFAACMVACASVTVLYRRLAPTSEAGRAQSNRLRLLVTRFSLRAAGLACLTYAATHAFVALSIAPTVRMQGALLITSALLCLAARQCFHDPRLYARPVLFWFGGRLREGALGLAAVEEGIQMRRTLARADPAHRSELAIWLHVLATRLGELGERGTDSLAAVAEAVDIRRDLAGSDANHLADLAASLHLSVALAWRLGRTEEASLAAIEQAIEIRRHLANTDPTQRAGLADSRYLRTVLTHRRRDSVAIGRVVFALSGRLTL